MKIWYDTEFLDDGKTIELISIGMVAEDGREFYAVTEDVAAGALHDRVLHHPWLMKNVVPHLPLRSRYAGEKTHQYYAPGTTGRSFFHVDLDDNVVMPRRMIRNGVRDFLRGDDESDPVELWAWYAAYDHVVLAQLWGPMSNLPAGVPMWTNDLRQEVHRLGYPQELPVQATGHHNALDDARHVRVMHEHLLTST